MKLTMVHTHIQIVIFIQWVVPPRITADASLLTTVLDYRSVTQEDIATQLIQALVQHILTIT